MHPKSASVFAPSIATAASVEKAAGQDAAGVDTRLFSLWRLRRDAAAAGRAASTACRQAEAKLPPWARSGPEFIDRDGKPSGEIVPWPAIELTAAQRARMRPGIVRRVRPGPQNIQQDFRTNVRCLDVKKAERLRDQEIARLDDRRRRQAGAEARLGLPALNCAAEAAWDRMLDIESKIQTLAPATPHVLAALGLIEIAHECEAHETIDLANGVLGAIVRLLGALRPLLSPGPIADELAELHDNPQKPLGLMALWPHGMNEPARGYSAAELEAIDAETNRQMAEAWRLHDIRYGHRA